MAPVTFPANVIVSAPAIPAEHCPTAALVLAATTASRRSHVALPTSAVSVPSAVELTVIVVSSFVTTRVVALALARAPVALAWRADNPALLAAARYRPKPSAILIKRIGI